MAAREAVLSGDWKTGAWSVGEDKLLVEWQAKLGNKWSAVAKHIPGRTGQQCAQRWRLKVNPHISKEKWTVEEDQKLMELVAKMGIGHWADISRHLPGRTDQQCMGRWRRHLDPNIKRDAWSADEDERLEQLYRKYHNSWACIARALTGRTPQQCRGRWQTLHAKDLLGRQVSDSDLTTPVPNRPAPVKKTNKVITAAASKLLTGLGRQLPSSCQGKEFSPPVSSSTVNELESDTESDDAADTVLKPAAPKSTGYVVWGNRCVSFSTQRRTTRYRPRLVIRYPRRTPDHIAGETDDVVDTAPVRKTGRKEDLEAGAEEALMQMLAEKSGANSRHSSRHGSPVPQPRERGFVATTSRLAQSELQSHPSAGQASEDVPTSTQLVNAVLAASLQAVSSQQCFMSPPMPLQVVGSQHTGRTFISADSSPVSDHGRAAPAPYPKSSPAGSLLHLLQAQGLSPAGCQTPATDKKRNPAMGGNAAAGASNFMSPQSSHGWSDVPALSYSAWNRCGLGFGVISSVKTALGRDVQATPDNMQSIGPASHRRTVSNEEPTPNRNLFLRQCGQAEQELVQTSMPPPPSAFRLQLPDSPHSYGEPVGASPAKKAPANGPPGAEFCSPSKKVKLFGTGSGGTSAASSPGGAGPSQASQPWGPCGRYHRHTEWRFQSLLAAFNARQTSDDGTADPASLLMPPPPPQLPLTSTYPFDDSKPNTARSASAAIDVPQPSNTHMDVHKPAEYPRPSSAPSLSAFSHRPMSSAHELEEACARECAKNIHQLNARPDPLLACTASEKENNIPPRRTSYPGHAPVVPSILATTMLGSCGRHEALNTATALLLSSTCSESAHAGLPDNDVKSLGQQGTTAAAPSSAGAGLPVGYPASVAGVSAAKLKQRLYAMLGSANSDDCMDETDSMEL